MDNPVPKVSFIPKSPLAREESFFERKRPQSAVGITAITLFVFFVGSYAGLYFYDLTLTRQIATKTQEINSLQGKFAASEQVTAAKVFRSRAELAKDLLANHVVISPIFTFLSDMTLQSVQYEKFSFKKGTDGWMLNLSGEAPGYASLAYQADVLRKKTAELRDMKVSNIALSKFGTVTFDLSLTFLPSYVSYASVSASADEAATFEAPVATSSAMTTKALVPAAPAETKPTGSAPASTVPAVATSSVSATAESGGWVIVPETATTNAGAVPAAAPAPTRSWWSWFKFW